MSELQTQIEQQLAELDPAIELIALEEPGGDTLRLYLDHPDGVDLGVCERATRHLGDLLADYSLEVSSPGTDRPLTKPEHFRRFLGRKVKVRTAEAVDGRRNFTGTLAAADESVVELKLDEGAVAIPLERIRRSNLLPDNPEVNPT